MKLANNHLVFLPEFLDFSENIRQIYQRADHFKNFVLPERQSTGIKVNLSLGCHRLQYIALPTIT
jgi:hypothetical protein